MTTQISKQEETARATQLIAGFNKHLTGVTSLTLASTAYTPAQVTAALQQLVDLRAAVDAAKAAAKGKLAAETAQAPALQGLMAALVSYVKTAYSASPDVLADFGLQPRKTPTPLTAEQKAAAVAKREATRKARGTTGPKAKLAVKGNVTGVVITPVTASVPVATSPAPSTPATAGGATGAATTHA